MFDLLAHSQTFKQGTIPNLYINILSFYVIWIVNHCVQIIYYWISLFPFFIICSFQFNILVGYIAFRYLVIENWGICYYRVYNPLFELQMSFHLYVNVVISKCLCKIWSITGSAPLIHVSAKVPIVLSIFVWSLSCLIRLHTWHWHTGHVFILPLNFVTRIGCKKTISDLMLKREDSADNFMENKNVLMNSHMVCNIAWNNPF